MKRKIILYDSHHLNLGMMQSFLGTEILTTNYDIEAISELNIIPQLIQNEDTVLILNSSDLTSNVIRDLIDKFRDINPSVKIMIHSLDVEVNDIKSFFDKGIKCYLGSKVSSEEFREALAQVIDGKVYITDDVKNMLVNYMCSQEGSQHLKSDLPTEITRREKEVLNLVCEGLRSKEIAEKLFISPHTVESHRRNIMLKFNISNSSRLVKFALDNHLVET
ncbi:response regulator transcription factor [Kaistella polysaccharea]|uniref:response regulator transcription factor n=1 Tax=Kaistella polysaccharea TaxID=2878534 RepID=UPI001CF56C02|nr:response regulator transcription factor [Kaistella polysaccharea]